jgi:diguanylate cyclase (GGDEF)-like protein/PAS domain S-box-containing protein
MPIEPPARAPAESARGFAHRYAIRAALIYSALAGLWVLLSDQLLSRVTDHHTLQQLSTAKGTAFVAITAVALYLLIDGLPAAYWAPDQGARAATRRAARWTPWLVLTAVATAVLGVSALGYRDRAEGLRQQQIDALRAVAALSQQDLTDWLNERRYNVSATAESVLVRQQLLDLPDPRAQLQLKSALGHLQHAHGYRAVEAWSPDGQRLVGGDDPLRPTPELLEAARRAARSTAVELADLHLDDRGRPRLALMARVRAAEGPDAAPIAVLVFELDPTEQLFQRVRHWPLASRSGELLLGRREGDEVLYLSPLRGAPGQALRLRLPLDSPSLPLATALRDGREVVEGIDYRGVPVIATAVPIPGTPWIVQAKVDRAEAMAPLRQELAEHALFATVGLAAALMLAGLIRQRARLQAAGREVEQAAALRVAEQRLRATFEQAAIGLCHVDRGGHLLRANALCQHLLGLPQADAAHLRLPDLLILSGAEQAALDEVLQGSRRSFSADLCARSGDAHRWLRVTVSGVHDEDGTQPYAMVALEDVSVRKLAAQTIERNEARLRSYMLHAPLGVVVLDTRGRVLEANPAALALTGATPHQLWLRVGGELLTERGRPLSRFAARPLLRHGHWYFEAWFSHPDKSARWVAVSVACVDADTRIAFVQDITERKHEERVLRQALALFQHTQEGLVITDPHGTIAAVNPAFCRITGYGERELQGRNMRMLSSGRQDAAFYRQFWQQLLAHGAWQGEIWNRRKNGDVYPEWLTVNAVLGPGGELQNYVATCTDITRNKASEQELERLAYHDALTGLGNRLLFVSTLEKALQRTHRDHHQGAVLMLDLDRFKTVNDSLGHPVGDLLLQEVAQRLSARLRQADTVARLGGDEFAVLLEDVGSAQHAGHIAQTLIEACSTPYVTPDGQEVYVGASVGISVFPGDSDDVNELLQQADAALYGAKDGGRGTFRFFTEAYTREAQNRLDLERGLRRALDEGQLELHYQPLTRASDGTVEGVEALVRWRHPERGLVSPASFIPLAEETGLIVPLGVWVLREACTQMQQWQRQGIELETLAVNLSPRQFAQPHLVEQVAAALCDSGLDSARLELEITESALMDAARAEQRLQQLKALGVRLSVDDFGTGYSSLAYLSRFPLDKLKIDQSFVRHVPQDAVDVEIVSAVISLARSLKLRVLAEGVETPAQCAFLRERGCDLLQGYWFAKPMPPAQLCAWLKERRPPALTPSASPAAA